MACLQFEEEAEGGLLYLVCLHTAVTTTGVMSIRVEIKEGKVI